jgi:hypothetical protein
VDSNAFVQVRASLFFWAFCLQDLAGLVLKLVKVFVVIDLGLTGRGYLLEVDGSTTLRHVVWVSITVKILLLLLGC